MANGRIDAGKEFQQYGRHAVEKAGTGFAFQNVGQFLWWLDTEFLWYGIHVFFSRGEKDVHPFFFQFFDVCLECTWIRVEIFVRAELQALTKMDATTGSPCFLASRISDRWPSCRFPMVGTKAVRNCPRNWLRSSSMVVTTFMMCRQFGKRLMEKVKKVFANGKSIILCSIVVLGQPYIDRCARFHLCYFN